MGWLSIHLRNFLRISHWCIMFISLFTDAPACTRARSVKVWKSLCWRQSWCQPAECVATKCSDDQVWYGSKNTKKTAQRTPNKPTVWTEHICHSIWQVMTSSNHAVRAVHPAHYLIPGSFSSITVARCLPDFLSFLAYLQMMDVTLDAGTNSHQNGWLSISTKPKVGTEHISLPIWQVMRLWQDLAHAADNCQHCSPMCYCHHVGPHTVHLEFNCPQSAKSDSSQ